MLVWGPDEPSTTQPSVSMTMAFAIVSLSAVNIGLVMRREREPPWSPPGVPLPGLDHPRLGPDLGRRGAATCSSACSTPTSLSGGQWGVVLVLSLIAPAFVGVDKIIQVMRQRRGGTGTHGAPHGPAGRRGVTGRRRVQNGVEMYRSGRSGSTYPPGRCRFGSVMSLGSGGS